LSVVAGAAADARELLARADALGRAYEALAAASQDEARRASLGRAAGRLAASVVRPLSAALGAVEGASAPETEVELGSALHDLARDATRMRVRVGGPAALLEATAALQDLTCQLVAEDEERLAARRGELASLQEPLAASIQSASDGPYLVTNVLSVTDWLGVSLVAAPGGAMSLRRLGAQAVVRRLALGHRLPRREGIGPRARPP